MTLSVDFSLEGNSYGSGNGIMVYLTPRVCNSKHESIGDYIAFSFSCQ
jgi:hypothetical protein